MVAVRRDVRVRAYVVLEDVARDEGLVDARVLVAFEVLQRVFGDALMLRSLCGTSANFLFGGHVLLLNPWATHLCSAACWGGWRARGAT